jgi:allophanate hydrolase subunit 2
MRAFTVLKPGLLTTVQDRGRPGLAYLGVPRSGAADLPALELANRLVGNDPAAAGLEFTVTGAVLRAEESLLVAVTGAPAPVRVAGVEVPPGAAVRVPAGAELAVGTARTGLRSYLAVAGGVAVPPVLGSRATDTLSGLGPAPLRKGDTIPIGTPPTVRTDIGAAAGPSPADVTATDAAPAAGPADAGTAVAGRDDAGRDDAGRDDAGRDDAGRDDAEPAGAVVVLRVHPGPRVDWFTPAAVRTLLSADYRVSPTSNRVGMRLTGPALARAVDTELPSEGVVLGAVQVPAGGEPLVFLADHPTTGGYPVIAVVDPADVPRAAQARPGTPVRFESEGVPGWT